MYVCVCDFNGVSVRCVCVCVWFVCDFVWFVCFVCLLCMCILCLCLFLINSMNRFFLNLFCIRGKIILLSVYIDGRISLSFPSCSSSSFPKVF